MRTTRRRLLTAAGFVTLSGCTSLSGDSTNLPDVTTDFDSGGGVSATVDEDAQHVTITLTDPQEYRFHGYMQFKLQSDGTSPVSFDVTNLDESNMPGNYQLLYATENGGSEWNRMVEPIGGGFEFEPPEETVYVANCHAYPYSRITDRVEEWSQHRAVETAVIGQTNGGRDIPVVRIVPPGTNPDGALDYVLVARQHPGEVHGSWHGEAIVEDILDRIDSTGFDRELVFHYLPAANPDGIYHGAQRHDMQGNNLNRHWNDSAPIEIAHMRDYMNEHLTDVHWGIDLHSTTNPEYPAAVLYHEDTASEADVRIANAMAAHSLSLSDTAGFVEENWLNGWFPTEFGAQMVATEAWAYYPYTLDKLYSEGREFFAETIGNRRNS